MLLFSKEQSNVKGSKMLFNNTTPNIKEFFSGLKIKATLKPYAE